MIPEVTAALSVLSRHPERITGIGRGIEREALRIQKNGQLSQQDHPAALGSALTHHWIITDFAEALLEFVTPVEKQVEPLLSFMSDLHRFAVSVIGEERLWPLSMPAKLADSNNIQLAKYGCSNIGQMKHIYRQGLKHRYGALMQIIAGIHYNFSLPDAFWAQGATDLTEAELQSRRSAGYLSLIRNYYRFGWLIPYLFGASPAVSENFVTANTRSLSLQGGEHGSFWLPFATSLRLSDLGYTNKSQRDLAMGFNSLDEYLAGLKRAIKTPSTDYAKLGILGADGERIQLNTNLLQIENELYAPIRPKRVTAAGEAPSEALLRAGIEYIEVRSLDINPFSPIGMSKEQVHLLDCFLIWCALADSPEMTPEQQQINQQNWQKVILEGRKPGLMLTDSHTGAAIELESTLAQLFTDFQVIAELLDATQNSDKAYQHSLLQLAEMVQHPDKTYSGRLLPMIQAQGMDKVGLNLAENYRQQLISEPMQILSYNELTAAALRSIEKQRQLEEMDEEDLTTFLAKRNG